MSKNTKSFILSDIYLIDKKNLTVLNVGKIRDKSLTKAVTTFDEILQGGQNQPVGSQLNVDFECLEVSQTILDNLEIYQNQNFNHVFFKGFEQTFILHNADISLMPNIIGGADKSNSLKLNLKKTVYKTSDLFYRIPSEIDPIKLILLFYPSLQKFKEVDNQYLELSSNKVVTYAGTGSLWESEKRWFKGNGIDRKLTIAENEFCGQEKIGNYNSVNRDFTGTNGAASGDWEIVSAGAGTGATNLINTNAQKFIFGTGPSVGDFLKLTTDISVLVVGTSYKLEFSYKRGSAWTSAIVKVTIGGCTKQIPAADITASYQTFTFDFIANSTTPTITFSTVTNAGVSTEEFWIDTISLRTSSKTNLNLGEMIFLDTNRGFEQNSIGDWAGVSSYAAGPSTSGQGKLGLYALEITNTGGAGGQNTIYVQLPSTKFKTLVSGKKYTIEAWVKVVSTTANISLGFGATGQTAIVNAVGTTYVKIAMNIVAGANDISQSLRFWSSGTQNFFIDEISITEIQDIAIKFWMKTDVVTSAITLGIISKRNFPSDIPGYNIYLDSAGNEKLGISYGDSNASSSTNVVLGVELNDNIANQIFIVFDKLNGIYTYKNGISLWSETTTFKTKGKITNNNSIIIGAIGTRFYEGLLGMISIENKLYTATEVLNSYNLEKSTYV